VWLLWAQYFCITFAFYFYITWLPTYLQDSRHQTPSAAARLAILPLLFGGFGSLTCGFLADRVYHRLGGARAGRRAIAFSGLVVASMLLWAVTRIQYPFTAMLVMGLASYSMDLVMPCAWSSCMDIGGKYAGTVSGSNTTGNLAGFCAPVIGGFLLDHTNNNWNLLIYMMAGVAAFGALFWLFIDPVTPIEET
jgi:ACS family glucarate transporter-like MFS transporter